MAHLLIADDDTDLLNTLSEALVFYGHTVSQARNGFEALDLFHNRQPDLGIIDVEMPGMTGLELTRTLKEEKPQFPVILITGFSHLYRPEDIFQLDIEAFLRKPLNLKELAEIVDQVLARNR